jgi:tRNA-specific 2-thiouridylase
MTRAETVAMGGSSIMVGLSGGVDSSVAALLLSRQGLPVQGLFMKNWEEDDRDGTCPAEQDAQDAESVARQLGIAFHARNFATEYWDGVFEAFLAEHRAGRTPNPDVLCNREIKFRTFLEHAEDLGAERIATGHYARSDTGPDGPRLLRGLDPGKDQSYFLHAITREALARTLFPVGALPKAQVRELAREAGLATHGKKDSTGICFIGERDFRGFLARYIAPRPGAIVDAAGRRIGSHQGLAFHTLGQRGGLGIGGVRGRSEAPWYVVGKDLAADRLIVDQDHDSPLLMASAVRTEVASWIAGRPPRARFDATAQCRYRQPVQACAVRVEDDGRLMVRFVRPQRAVTPGQSLVVYDGEVCLGGAVIAATDAAWGGLSAPPSLQGEVAGGRA